MAARKPTKLNAPATVTAIQLAQNGTSTPFKVTDHPHHNPDQLQKRDQGKDGGGKRAKGSYGHCASPKWGGAGRIDRAAAADKLAKQVAALEAALPGYLEQSRALADALSGVSYFHFESGQMASFNAEHHGLAIEDKLLLSDLSRGLDYPRIAARPIVAAAHDQAHEITIALAEADSRRI